MLNGALKPGTYRYGVECGLQRALAAVAALFAMSWSALLVVTADRLTADLLVMAMSFVALTVVVAIRGARVGLGRSDVLVPALVALGADAVIAIEQPSLIVVGQRCMLTVPVVLLAIGFLPRPTAWPVSLLAIGGQLAASWPMDGPVGAIQGVWPVAAAATAAAVLAPAPSTARRTCWCRNCLNGRVHGQQAGPFRAPGSVARHCQRRGCQLLHPSRPRCLPALVAAPRSGGRGRQLEAVKRGQHDVPHARRPRSPVAPTAAVEIAPTPSAGLPRHRAPMAPRPAPPTPREGISPQAPRPAPHHPLHPPAGATTRRRESDVGLPARARRTGRPGHQDRRLHRVEHPARARN
ncbi:hypothetical protein ABH941_000021 [Streptacidiphilus sp. EB103A]